jgi:4-hydroxybenzoate polyprenyltransferase
MHLGARFLFVFAIAILFDIRDLKHDDSALKTIPIIFGQSKARFIAVVALFIAEVIAIIQHMNCWISFQHLIAITSLLFLSLILVIKSNRDRGEMFYSFWVELLSIALYLFLSLSTLMF